MLPNDLIVMTPTRGTILTEAQNALEQEYIGMNLLPVVLRTFDQPLPLSRNFLAEKALEIPDWTHALLLDDDIILPKGSLKQLYDLKTDVAVMNYPMHGKLQGQFAGTVTHNKDKSVAYAGLGVVLVKREVFEKIPSPWFIMTSYRVRRDDKGEIGFYAGQKDGINLGSGGEDCYFYLQCKKHGFKIKETKLTATHARIDQLIMTLQSERYTSHHKIVKVDKIEREAF